MKNTTNSEFDLIVVGAGSAGFSAAITAAEQGASVALIGHGTIGGTCVNVGCVPSKTMIRATEALHQAATAARFAGIHAEARVEDWQALVRQKDELVAELRQAKYLDLLPEYARITYLQGQARLTEGGVAINGASLESKRCVVATGSKATLPAIPGLDDVPYLTSTEALDLTRLPKSLLVVGAGYIGCELAQMFARAGVEVTLLCRSRLLPEAEPEVGALLAKCFIDEGIELIGGVTYEAVERTQSGVVLTLTAASGIERLEAERILIAAGRQANSQGLGLRQAGIAIRGDGAIEVDACMRTSKSGVYAAGDVTGRDQFVYMAAHGGKIAALNALVGDTRAYDDRAIPAVVFTDPQVASVGLTEAAALQQGHDVKTSLFPLSQLPRALAARDTRGLIKLVADRGTDRLLGAHLIAPEGADAIQTAVLAIKHKLTVSDLAETIFPYLTTVEGLKLAAQTFDKDVTKLSCCAG